MNAFKLSVGQSCAPRLMFTGVVAMFCAPAAAQETATAQETVLVRAADLEAPTPLRSVDGELIESLDWCVPTVADIDGDGRQDLVVGQFMNHKVLREGTGKLGSAGSVRWYRNVAFGGAARYEPGVDLKCDDGLLYAANW